MPGAVEEDSTADVVKVFKTEGEAEEQQTSVVLREDKADISFRAEIERDKGDAPVPSTSASAAAIPSGNGRDRKSHVNGVNSLGSKHGTAFCSPGKGVSSSATAASSSINPCLPLGIDPHAWAAAHLAAYNNMNGPLHNMNGLQAALAAQAAAAASPGQYFFLPHISPAWGQQFSLPAAAAASPFAPPFGFGMGAGRTPGATPPALSLAAQYMYGMGLSPTYASPLTAHGLSPSFMDPNLAALAARGYGSPQMGSAAASPANLSPLHSPTTGAPIAPTQHPKREPIHQDFLHLGKMGASVSLPASFHHFSRMGAMNNPLQSIARLPLPQVTTPSHMATSMAEQQRRFERSDRNGMRREERHSKKQEPHVKKPLNAFMIFMKENRAKLMAEKGYKERQSAELNKELGRLWHTLSQEEQQKYYVMSREARNEHMKMNPGWTARDNYAIHKKRKRKRDKTLETNELKKCRARFGLDQQTKWCKHCRRKKKCLAFREAELAAAKEEQSPPMVTSTTQGSPEGPLSISVGSPSSSAGRGVVSSSVNDADEDDSDDSDDDMMSDDDDTHRPIDVTLVAQPNNNDANPTNAQTAIAT